MEIGDWLHIGVVTQIKAHTTVEASQFLTVREESYINMESERTKMNSALDRMEGTTVNSVFNRWIYK